MHSDMARVDEGSHFLPATHVYPQTEWATMLLLHSCRARTHFGWYSFPFRLRVGGWVGLSGLLHTKVVCHPKTVTIPLLIRSDVELLCWCTQHRYHYTKTSNCTESVTRVQFLQLTWAAERSHLPHCHRPSYPPRHSRLPDLHQHRSSLPSNIIYIRHRHLGNRSFDLSTPFTPIL